MKSIVAFLLAFFSLGLGYSQSLIPNPFAYASCISFASPTGWTNCTGSPDCAASRCTVPGGCSGQAVMCFGESFYYLLAAPLNIGQNYTISMNVSTGQLGGSTIIGGNHTFQVIGLTSAPTNCLGANYGSVCSTPGATTLLTGTVNTIGWVSFSNTFTATAAIRYIVIGNCDGTGNGGNLFCNFTLTNSVVLPVEIAAFDAQLSSCEVDLQWSIGNDGDALSRFELVKSIEGRPDEAIANVLPQQGVTEYAFADKLPAVNCDYQLRLHYQDGAVTQSQVVHIASDCDDQHTIVEGNPVRGNEAVLRYRATGESMHLTISNTEGRVVYEGQIDPAEAGWQRQSLDVSKLIPGIYFITTSNGEVTKLQILR